MRPRHRRGVAVAATVATLIVVELILVGLIITLARDHDLTVKRMDTLQSFYAAEAGMNMAMRELIEDADEDSDGTIGTISDDSNDANDPDVGEGQCVVTAQADTPVVGQTTITCTGRAGDARREISGVIE